MPIRVPLEPRLIADCPSYVKLPPDGPLTFEMVDGYLAGLETALSQCRGQLELLRKQEARAAARRASEAP